jgi:hypothetical protein
MLSPGTGYRYNRYWLFQLLVTTTLTGSSHRPCNSLTWFTLGVLISVEITSVSISLVIIDNSTPKAPAVSVVHEGKQKLLVHSPHIGSVQSNHSCAVLAEHRPVFKKAPQMHDYSEHPRMLYRLARAKTPLGISLHCIKTLQFCKLTSARTSSTVLDCISKWTSRCALEVTDESRWKQIWSYN